MVFAYFLPSGGSKIDQKSIKIASQSGLKLRCRKNTQKSSEMVPTWFQKRPKLGAQNALNFLGPVWGPSKSEERTTPKTRPKNNTPLEASWVGKAKTTLSAGLTRGVGGLQIYKNWKDLARNLHVVYHSCTPQGGGAGSNCPAGQPRHRAWDWVTDWLIDCS